LKKKNIFYRFFCIFFITFVYFFRQLIVYFFAMSTFVHLPCVHIVSFCIIGHY
jgi:hypothetical protein